MDLFAYCSRLDVMFGQFCAMHERERWGKASVMECAFENSKQGDHRAALLAILDSESNFRPVGRSKIGNGLQTDFGVCQMTLPTFQGLLKRGVVGGSHQDLVFPDRAIVATASFLLYIKRRRGTWEEVLDRYAGRYAKRLRPRFAKYQPMAGA